VENKLGHLYTGITTDPVRRLRQHRGELAGGAKALKGKAPLNLKAVFIVGTRAQASQLENQVKRMATAKKRHIIANKKLYDLPCVLEQLQVPTV
jgi:putative endonuclease